MADPIGRWFLGPGAIPDPDRDVDQGQPERVGEARALAKLHGPAQPTHALGGAHQRVGGE